MLCRQARSQDLIVLGKVILERLDALTVVNPHLIGSVETGTFPVTSEASRLPCDVHVLSQIEYCARNFNFNCNSTIFVKTKDSSNSKWVSLYLNICSSLPFVTVAIIALINWSNYTDFKHSGMSSLDDGISSLIKILPLLLPREYTSGLIHLENGRGGGRGKYYKQILSFAAKALWRETWPTGACCGGKLGSSATC